MATHRVRRGDTSALIAFVWGVPWPEIWGAPANASLRATRPGDPPTLSEGDSLTIPIGDETIDGVPRENVVQLFPTDRARYLEAAYQHAFRQSVADAHWNPDDGFRANRPRLVQMYDYYGWLYGQAPAKFLWAGLGKLAGATVVRGLDLMVSVMSPSVSAGGEAAFVRIAKAIFTDIAWLHEAYLDDPRRAINLAIRYDAFPRRVRLDGSALPPRYIATMRGSVRIPDWWTLALGASYYAHQLTQYGRALQYIDMGSHEAAVVGNFALLANEQWSVIQPYYDEMGGSAGGILSAATDNVHPYHRGFLLDVPNGDIFAAPDRWRWITTPMGMVERWGALPPNERSRLVELPFERLVARDWGPIPPELELPGTPYSEVAT